MPAGIHASLRVGGAAWAAIAEGLGDLTTPVAQESSHRVRRSRSMSAVDPSSARPRCWISAQCVGQSFDRFAHRRPLQHLPAPGHLRICFRECQTLTHLFQERFRAQHQAVPRALLGRAERQLNPLPHVLRVSAPPQRQVAGSMVRQHPIICHPVQPAGRPTIPRETRWPRTARNLCDQARHRQAVP